MKMLRDQKHFSRCGLVGGKHIGHGSCCVTEEIQSVPCNRARDKRLCQQEIDCQLLEYIQDKWLEFMDYRYEYFLETRVKLTTHQFDRYKNITGNIL